MTASTTTLFTDKTVLVTGGGTGIGRALALAFAAEGATVLVTGRRAAPLEETVGRIQASGGSADAIPADLTDPAQVVRLLDTVVDRYGRLDIAVNNAGMNTPGMVADFDEGAWDEIVATNLTSVWLSMKHEIIHMRRSGGGVIVNVSSVVGPHGTIPGMGAYAATKAAVSALTRTAAVEYVGDGIRINAISPGAMDTPMSRHPGESDADRAERMTTELPIGRVGSLDEIAGAVLWLASPTASYAIGHDLVLDGGATV